MRQEVDTDEESLPQRECAHTSHVKLLICLGSSLVVALIASRTAFASGRAGDEHAVVGLFKYWDHFIDVVFDESRSNCDKVAIISMASGELYTSSTHEKALPIDKDARVSLASQMQLTPEYQDFSDGLKANGVLYTDLHNNGEGVVGGKIDHGHIAVYGGNQVILIAHTPEGKNMNSCHETLYHTARQLADQYPESSQ